MIPWDNLKISDIRLGFDEKFREILNQENDPTGNRNGIRWIIDKDIILSQRDSRSQITEKILNSYESYKYNGS